MNKQEQQFFDWILGRPAPHPFAWLKDLPEVPYPVGFNPNEDENRKNN